MVSDGSIYVIPKRSDELKVGVDLPKRADVLITETIDCGLVGEGIIPSVRHARQHLLSDRPVIIPAKAKIICRLLESHEIHQLNFVNQAAGYDVRLLNALSTKCYFPVRLRFWKYRFLSDPHVALDFNFYNDSLEPRRERAFITVTKPGLVHGIGFWFELELGTGIRLNNSPANLGSHWHQAVQCFESPLIASRNQQVELLIRQDDSMINFEINS
jgi:type II protein arginine methyltransferase